MENDTYMSLYIYIKMIKIDNVIITLDVVSVGSRISSVSIAKNNDDEMHPFFQGTLVIKILPNQPSVLPKGICPQDFTRQ